MPNSPKRYYPRNGGGTAYKPRERRGTAQQRGYDTTWLALRNSHLARYPYCQDCPYPRAQYVEVDHIIPFSGQDDPLRLDERNLRTRCRRHHARKTAMQDRIKSMFVALRQAGAPYDCARDATLVKWENDQVRAA